MATVKSPNLSLRIPSWIKVKYFTKILQNSESNFRKMKQLNAVHVADLGDNYTSIMLRIYGSVRNKDGSEAERSFILKTMLEPENPIEFVKTLGLFPKEKDIYSNLLPQFESLYSQLGVDIKFGPECLYTEETPKRITLILEDLKTLEFENVDRLRGMDMRQMASSLKKLAEFHAASVVWHSLHGDFDVHFQTCLAKGYSRRFFEERSEDLIETFKIAMQKWGLDNCGQYISKLPSPQQYVEELIQLSCLDKKSFNVLNHGDFWGNNIMFKCNEAGGIEETLFVDFQLCKYGPPTYDLYSLILISASINIKTSRMELFLEIYQEELMKSLLLLNYIGKIPNLNDIKRMMHRDRFYVILMPPNAEEMEQKFKSGKFGQEIRLKSMMNPIYAQHMRQIMPWLCNEGYLDF